MEEWKPRPARLIPLLRIKTRTKAEARGVLFLGWPPQYIMTTSQRRTQPVVTFLTNRRQLHRVKTHAHVYTPTPTLFVRSFRFVRSFVRRIPLIIM